MNMTSTDIAVIGAGNIGISVAYYLKKSNPSLRVTLIDQGSPMAFTSAQSGENYRNWWQHPVMMALSNDSIDLMEEIARDSNNQINMNRRGYVLATRSNDTDNLVSELYSAYEGDPLNTVRMHDSSNGTAYEPPVKEDWETAPSGVDILQDPSQIRHHFPWYDEKVNMLIHIRRAGDISGQQMGQYMLDCLREWGGQRIQGKVTAIEKSDGFVVHLSSSKQALKAGKIVIAAGPFVNEIARMLGESLPVHNILQQKIAFEDTKKAIPRRMPFSIDMDRQYIDWSGEEKEALSSEAEYAWLTKEMPPAIHCRPDGGDHGNWIKLGWAYNEAIENEISFEPSFSDNFPEIVLRGAARLNPALKSYYGNLPRNMTHYGGYYTMTAENWPLIGPMNTEGSYVVGAMSGFGTMAACSAGNLAAKWILGDKLPSYADMLAPNRYSNASLMADLTKQDSKGIL